MLESSLTNSMILEVLNKEEYKYALSDKNSYEYAVLNCFVDMDVTEDNCIIFYSIIKDLKDGIFTLNDIINFILDNNLNFTIDSLDLFLNNQYYSIKKQREKKIYEKVLFKKFKNGVLIEWFQSLFDGTLKEKPTYGFIHPSDETSPILYNEEYWNLFPLVNYEEKPVLIDGKVVIPFRSIIDAERDYFKKIKAVEFQKLTETTTVFNIVYEEIRNGKYEEDLDWFIIDRKIPHFLRKIVQKGYFHPKYEYDREIAFALKRSGNTERGLTHKEFFDLFGIFCEEFNTFLTEKKQFGFFDDSIEETDEVKLIKEFLKQSDPVDGIINDHNELLKIILYNAIYYFFSSEIEQKEFNGIETITKIFGSYKTFSDIIEEFLNSVVRDDKRYTRGMRQNGEYLLHRG